MKLISMTDFVLGTLSVLDNHNPLGLNESRVSRYISITNYAKFLKQPLTLGMFVPCDENGNVLEEPEICFAGGGVETSEYIKYKQAKEKVLFEGFNFDGYFVTLPNGQYLDYSKLPKLIIEDIVKENLTLTPNAIKQLEL